MVAATDSNHVSKRSHEEDEKKETLEEKTSKIKIRMIFLHGTKWSNVEGNPIFLDIAQTRYCVDISVYHRYIGDGSVYRRSFKDKFVTIRQLVLRSSEIAFTLLMLSLGFTKIGDFRAS